MSPISAPTFDASPFPKVGPSPTPTDTPIPPAKAGAWIEIAIDPDSECRYAQTECGAAYFGYEPVDPPGPAVQWEIVGIPGQSPPAQFPAQARLKPLPPGTYRLFAHAGPRPVATIPEYPTTEMINWCEVDVTIEPYIEFVDGTLYFGPDGCGFGRLAMGSWHEHPAIPTLSPAPTPNTYPPTAIRFPERAMRSVRIGYECDAYTADGPRAICQQNGELHLVDLVHGRNRVVGETTSDISGVAFDGPSVAWLEGTVEMIPDPIPCRSGGSLTWSLVLFDLETRERSVVASGVHTHNEYCGPAWPVFDIDGANLALAVEAPDSGWQVSIRPLQGGETIRTLSSTQPVESVALSNGDLAFVVGIVEGVRLRSDPWTTFASTRLMLSTADAAEPVEVAADTFAVKLDAGRLAWMRGQDRNITGTFGQLMTATTEDHQPIQLADIDYPQHAVGDGFVAWGDGLNLWRSASGKSAHLAPDNWGGLYEINLSDGWLTWVGFKGDYIHPDLAYGIPVEQIPLD